MQATFEKLIEFAHGVVKGWYVEGEGEGDPVIPTFFGVTADDRMVILAAPWGNDVEKAMLVEKIREYFKEHGIVMYAFVSESWMSSSSAKTGIRPAESEDRQEAVIISVCDEKFSLTKALKIVRSEAGDVTSIDEILFTDEEPHPHGDPKLNRMTTLLAPKSEEPEFKYPGLMNMMPASHAIH